MDATWIDGRIAVGGGIWNDAKMIELVRAGVTHIINMQIEFDDRPLAEPYGVEVLWNAVDDDFLPKPVEIFRKGVDFARAAFEQDDAKLYIHCAAGIHRAPMMTLAVLASQGWELDDAMATMQRLRPAVDFPDVYLDSVKGYLRQAKSHAGAQRK